MPDVRPRLPMRQKRTLPSADGLTIYRIFGREYDRIRYGDEADDWGANSRPCHDCGVTKGQFHVFGAM